MQPIHNKVEPGTPDSVCHECLQCWYGDCRAFEVPRSEAERLHREAGDPACITLAPERNDRLMAWGGRVVQLMQKLNPQDPEKREALEEFFGLTGPEARDLVMLLGWFAGGAFEEALLRGLK